MKKYKYKSKMSLTQAPSSFVIRSSLNSSPISEKTTPTTKKIFLGGLPAGCKRRDILNAFKSYGTIQTVNLIKDMKTYLCKGFGDISIRFESKRKFAIFLKQEFFMRGRKIYVEEFLEGNKLEKKNSQLYEKRVFIKDLPVGITDAELFGIFSQFGKVQSAYQIKSVNGRLMSYGYVTFFKFKAAQSCVKQGKVTLRDGTIKCFVFHKRHLGKKGAENVNKDLDNPCSFEVNGHDKNLRKQNTGSGGAGDRKASGGLSSFGHTKGKEQKKTGNHPLRISKGSENKHQGRRDDKKNQRGTKKRNKFYTNESLKRTRMFSALLDYMNEKPGSRKFDYETRMAKRHLEFNVRFNKGE